MVTNMYYGGRPSDQGFEIFDLETDEIVCYCDTITDLMFVVRCLESYRRLQDLKELGAI